MACSMAMQMSSTTKRFHRLLQSLVQWNRSSSGSSSSHSVVPRRSRQAKREREKLAARHFTKTNLVSNFRLTVRWPKTEARTSSPMPLLLLLFFVFVISGSLLLFCCCWSRVCIFVMSQCPDIILLVVIHSFRSQSTPSAQVYTAWECD